MIRKPKALVIEDYMDQAMVFQRALEMAGFDTEMITDGDVARTRLTEVVPVLIVLDLHLPGMTGDYLLKQIRTDRRMHKTRVVVATADALMAQNLREQADIVLLKPISFRQLNQLAERYYAHPKA
ncbi:MAG: response regulator [Chloroflexota bacterium]